MKYCDESKISFKTVKKVVSICDEASKSQNNYNCREKKYQSPKSINADG